LVSLNFEKLLYNFQEKFIFIKGIVHPKMKIKSLITHPHAVPTQ